MGKADPLADQRADKDHQHGEQPKPCSDERPVTHYLSTARPGERGRAGELSIGMQHIVRCVYSWFGHGIHHGFMRMRYELVSGASSQVSGLWVCSSDEHMQPINQGA
ncbi:MAG TPA: hypothetical protein VGC62_13915 [Pseudomonas sp.]|uniref:hypothetical protein n=1 Tax=Pseudomonas sp. TaxID=306 RepID=UPI002EDB0A88